MSIYGDIEAICQPKSFDFLSKNRSKDEFWFGKVFFAKRSALLIYTAPTWCLDGFHKLE
jgi:hypothetical protein